MKGFNVDIYYVPALGATGGRPDLLPENSTPPPTFAEALSDQRQSRMASQK